MRQDCREFGRQEHPRGSERLQRTNNIKTLMCLAKYRANYFSDIRYRRINNILKLFFCCRVEQLNLEASYFNFMQQLTTFLNNGTKVTMQQSENDVL